MFFRDIILPMYYIKEWEMARSRRWLCGRAIVSKYDGVDRRFPLQFFYWAFVLQMCFGLPANLEQTGPVIAALPLRHLYLAVS